jgi:prepilin-type N-terminal cleavage/methylation domain-containing protein
MSASRSRSFQSGMTLTELIVVSAILMSLTGVVYASFRYESQTFNRESAKAMTQGDLRLWLGRMVNDIRRANYDPTDYNSTAVRFSLLTFSYTDLTFTSDLNSNGSLDTSPVETLGYRLNNGTLQLNQNGTWRTVLTGVTSTQLFTYYDSQGVALTCITSVSNTCTTSEKRSIATVGITLTAQTSTGGDPGISPPVIQETATAGFRNPIL